MAVTETDVPDPRPLEQIIGEWPDWLAEAVASHAVAGEDDRALAAWARHWGPVVLEDLRQIYENVAVRTHTSAAAKEKENTDG